MLNLVLIPILVGIIALVWTMFFWFIKIKSEQVLWSIGIASCCASLAGCGLLFLAPSNAIALVFVALVSIMPICKTYDSKDVHEALQPLPYSLVLYTVLMLGAYMLSTS